MDHDHTGEKRRNWWATPSGIACIFFLAAAAYFLFTEHREHVVPYLPWLILLACPLMHFFHHGSHGGHHHDNADRESDTPPQKAIADLQSQDMQENTQNDAKNQHQHKHGGC